MLNTEYHVYTRRSLGETAAGKVPGGGDQPCNPYTQLTPLKAEPGTPQCPQTGTVTLRTGEKVLEAAHVFSLCCCLLWVMVPMIGVKGLGKEDPKTTNLVLIAVIENHWED